MRDGSAIFGSHPGQEFSLQFLTEWSRFSIQRDHKLNRSPWLSFGGLSDRDSAIALGIVCPPERRPAAQEIKKSPDWPV
jgi:hypothetical protein